MRLPNRRFCANCPTYDFGTEEDCNCETYKAGPSCFGSLSKTTAPALCEYCPRFYECFDEEADKKIEESKYETL